MRLLILHFILQFRLLWQGLKHNQWLSIDEVDAFNHTISHNAQPFRGGLGIFIAVLISYLFFLPWIIYNTLWHERFEQFYTALHTVEEDEEPAVLLRAQRDERVDQWGRSHGVQGVVLMAQMAEQEPSESQASPIQPKPQAVAAMIKQAVTLLGLPAQSVKLISCDPELVKQPWGGQIPQPITPISPQSPVSYYFDFPAEEGVERYPFYAVEFSSLKVALAALTGGELPTWHNQFQLLVDDQMLFADMYDDEVLFCYLKEQVDVGLLVSKF
uniref:Uncharacterized protein n=1 Tax=Magnetococcus massalia (strain MO-1) TaxID=451514 RepID=A0A1S7LH88_MAGMO|nr:Protein of unknown function [Candidatus Magnetococcus massalia]